MPDVHCQYDTVTGGNIFGWRFVVDANIFPGINIRQGVGACFLAGQTQDQCAFKSIGPNNTEPRFLIAVAAGRRNWFYVPVAGPGGSFCSGFQVGPSMLLRPG